MLVRPLSTVDNTRDYARVSHSIDSGLTITFPSVTILTHCLSPKPSCGSGIFNGGGATCHAPSALTHFTGYP